MLGRVRGACRWCGARLSSSRAKTCSRRCRQAVWRLERRAALELADEQPGRFAYADPPYPGYARRCYGDQPSYAGEVDHGELVASLVDGGYTGWALSTSARSLGDVLALCPGDVRVCAWVKPYGVSSRARGLASAWEPLIVWAGRQRPPGVRDWLRAMPARGEGDLIGRKPQAFCAWLFRVLGMRPGDQLADLFPGSGIVGRSWAALCADPSPTTSSDGPSRSSRSDGQPSSLQPADGAERRGSPATSARSTGDAASVGEVLERQGLLFEA